MVLLLQHRHPPGIRLAAHFTPHGNLRHRKQRTSICLHLIGVKNRTQKGAFAMYTLDNYFSWTESQPHTGQLGFPDNCLRAGLWARPWFLDQRRSALELARYDQGWGRRERGAGGHRGSRPSRSGKREGRAQRVLGGGGGASLVLSRR